MDLATFRWFVLSTLLVPLPAGASGLLVPSDAGAPVSQVGERALLVQEGTSITAHVQLYYRGQPTDFAWLLPVPAMPQIEPGNGQLFDQLATVTQSAYQLDRFYRCGSTAQQVVGSMNPVPLPPGLTSPDGTLAPYDSAVLTADSQDAVVKWLVDQKVPVPAGLTAALGPYIGHGGYIVALRFRSTQAAGALQPVVLHYQGAQLSLPIMAGAGGATQNMPLQVWLLGPSRAVPLNSVHAVLNDAQLNWFAGGGNYQDVLSRTVAESGGRAFVTEYAGGSSVAHDALGGTFDPARYPYLTRLSTVLASADLVQDLTFSYNQALLAVANVQLATLTYHCPAHRRSCVEPSYSGYLDPGYADYGYYDPFGIYIAEGDWSQVDYGDASGGPDPVWYDNGGDYSNDPGSGDNGGGDNGGGGGDNGGGDGSDRAVGRLSRSLSTGYSWALLLTTQGWKIGYTAQAADQGLFSPPSMPYSLRTERLSQTGQPQPMTDNTEAIKAALGIGPHAPPPPSICQHYSGCSASPGGRSGPTGELMFLLAGLCLLLWRSRRFRRWPWARAT